MLGLSWDPGAAFVQLRNTWEIHHMAVLPFKLTAFAGTLTLVAGMASASTHTTVDFTDASVWTDSSSSVTVFAGTGAESEVTISADPDALTFTPPVPRDDAPFGPLVSTSEGAGVSDDEISFPNDSITVSFSSPGVLFKGVHLGKLFSNTNDDEAEIAVLTFSGGEVVQFVGAVPFVSNTTGYQFFALPKAIRTNSVTFTAFDQNDGKGSPDYALLGVDVAPVPIPASLALLISALGGLGFLSRRRQAA